MRSTLSQNMLEAMNGQSTGEVILPLVKLTQSGWDSSICIVPNNESINHDGDEYLPLSFQINLPDEEVEGVPVLDWQADNVDRRLVEAMRTVNGAVQARIVWVLASSPEHIEVGPLEVEMRAAQYDAYTIKGKLGVEPILESQFGKLVMNPKNSPALF